MALIFSAFLVVTILIVLLVRYVYVEFFKTFKKTECTPRHFEMALNSSMSDRRVLRMAAFVEYHNMMTLEQVRRHIMERRPNLFASIQYIDSKKPIL